MRLSFVMTLAAFSTAVVLSAAPDNFRVELYSKSGVREVTLTAERGPICLCEATNTKDCLLANPRETARCVAQGNDVRCSANGRTWIFAHLAARSDFDFPLEALPHRSDVKEGARSVLVHAANLRVAAGRMSVVAAIDVETYVQGVLAGEAATFSNPNALDAMAILARTWALRSRGRHRAEGFDFCSLTHCQFFRPPQEAAGETSHIQKAVRDTAGLVLKYDGGLIDAYYSANCGGATATAGDVWPGSGRPYLRSVRDTYSAGDAQSSWTRSIPWNELRAALATKDGPMFRELAIDTHDQSGRVRTLRLIGDPPRRIDAKEFRYTLNRKLGWNTLKSGFFTIEPQGDAVMFRGRGLGHGVGLCQAGAEQMGQLGIGYEQILAHYFPGTKLENAESRPPARVLSSEHFDLFYPSSEEGLAAKALQMLESYRMRLGERATALPTRLTVRTWATTAEFMRATGQPGWVSGSNDGRVIDLQPLSVLESRGNLRATLHHELLHVVIRRIRAPQVPRWYEEGLILYLTGERLGELSGSNSVAPPSDEVFTSPRSANETRLAYAWARQRVMEVARGKSEAALWQVLEHPTDDDLRCLKNGK